LVVVLCASLGTRYLSEGKTKKEEKKENNPECTRSPAIGEPNEGSSLRLSPTLFHSHRCAKKKILVALVLQGMTHTITHVLPTMIGKLRRAVALF
jgi:hypothetical protein